MSRERPVDDAGRDRPDDDFNEARLHEPGEAALSRQPLQRLDTSMRPGSMSRERPSPTRRTAAEIRTSMRPGSMSRERQAWKRAYDAQQALQ